MKNILIILFLTVVVGEMTSTNFEKTVFASNKFSHEFMKSLLNMEDENVAFSPVSIWRALNMIKRGDRIRFESQGYRQCYQSDEGHERNYVKWDEDCGENMD